MFKAGFIGKTTKFASHLKGLHLLEIFRHNPEGVGFMGRGMLLNVVKKTNAEIVSIHDISDKNINEFMDSLSSAEQAKVRVCGSPADVGSSLFQLARLSILTSSYHITVMFIYLCIYLFIHLSILFLLNIITTIYITIYLSVYLSTYLSTYIYLFFPFLHSLSPFSICPSFSASMNY